MCGHDDETEAHFGHSQKENWKTMIYYLKIWGQNNDLVSQNDDILN